MIPARPQPILICEIEAPQTRTQRGDRRTRVQQAQLCTVQQRREALIRRVEMIVVALDESLEGGRRGADISSVGGASQTGLEACVADGQGRIDAHEDEEGAAEQDVERGLVPDRSGDPALAPSLCDEVDEGLDVGERHVAVIVVGRGFYAVIQAVREGVWLLLDGGCRGWAC